MERLLVVHLPFSKRGKTQGSFSMSDDIYSEAIDGMDLTDYGARLEKELGNDLMKIRRISQAPTDNTVAFKTFRTSQDTISIAIEELENTFSVSNVQRAFETRNQAIIAEMCKNIVKNTSNNPSIISNLIIDEDLIEIVKESAGIFTSEALLADFLEFVLLLPQNSESEIIDMTFLMDTQTLLESFPLLILKFYQKVPSVSVFGRNAMICFGIISDIILACHSDDDQVVVAAASALLAIYSCHEPADPELTADYLPEVIELLQIESEEAVSIVMQTLGAIANLSANFVSSLFKHDVHVYIANALQNQSLIQPALSLAESMTICDADGIQKFMTCGVMAQVISMITTPYQETAFRVLTNSMESAPDLMLQTIDNQFLVTTASLLADSQFNILKDIVSFTATLIKYVPDSEVSFILEHHVLTQIVEMLEADIPSVVRRCLDALDRIVHVAYNDESVMELLDQSYASDDIEEKLESLTDSDMMKIARNAAAILYDIKLVLKIS